MTNQICISLWPVGNLIYNPAYAVLVFERGLLLSVSRSSHKHGGRLPVLIKSTHINDSLIYHKPQSSPNTMHRVQSLLRTRNPGYDTRACPMDRGRENVKPATRRPLANALDDFFLSNMALMFSEMTSPFHLHLSSRTRCAILNEFQTLSRRAVVLLCDLSTCHG